MNRPSALHTKIFLDSGDPKETETAIELLGFIDGQTTNPSLISKNPEVQEKIRQNKTFTTQELLEFYKETVQQISSLIPHGSVSIEVDANHTTTAEEMHSQAVNISKWIPNVHIKYPSNTNGFAAAEQSTKEGMRVNMTLCFTQDQAAAVHAATKNATSGDVFVSPFIGRLDDSGYNGIDLIENIQRMYQNQQSHVQVLAASIRSYDHFRALLQRKVDIVTVPLKILQEWHQDGLPIVFGEWHYHPIGLQEIPFRLLDLAQPWQSFNLSHELTRQGIESFTKDWNELITKTSS